MRAVGSLAERRAIPAGHLPGACGLAQAVASAAHTSRLAARRIQICMPYASTAGYLMSHWWAFQTLWEMWSKRLLTALPSLVWAIPVIMTWSVTQWTISRAAAIPG